MPKAEAEAEAVPQLTVRYRLRFVPMAEICSNGTV